MRHTAAGRQILLDALDVMSEIESDDAAAIGPGDAAALKLLLTRLLEQIDPAGGLRAR